jgi:hypothetical protein
MDLNKVAEIDGTDDMCIFEDKRDQADKFDHDKVECMKIKIDTDLVKTKDEKDRKLIKPEVKE